jgi:sec-independent protein translocase protein TatA
MGLDNPVHIAFLLILLLLVFGAKRLPEMGRSLGAGMRGFKESLSGQSTELTPTAVQQQPAATAADAPAGPRAEGRSESAPTPDQAQLAPGASNGGASR